MSAGKFELLERQIRGDLSPFCDPGTILDLQRTGSSFVANWRQRRRERSAVFELNEPFDVTVRACRESLSYRSFFASEEMSDLYGIAQTSLDLHSTDDYVETMGVSTDASDASEKSAIDLIRGMVELDAADRDGTSFTMVTGEAGAGKTWVLKELVRRQAKAYCEGRASYVFLYIDAQGRALAKFHEALSTELNELRVGLPYHAVAPMVRLGLLVPVVDGFDELIGVGGYDDAFSSIANFVNELQGRGAIVASARSTYYEQEFLSRVGRGGELQRQSWMLRSLLVKSWGVDQREQFVYMLSHGDEEKQRVISEKLRQVFSGPNEKLADKPLFYARTALLIAAGGQISGDGSLTEQLIDAFISRELTDKLLDRNGNQILTKSELWSLIADLSEEMWNQSTRELDKATIRDAAEYAMLGSSTPEASKSIVIERMPSMAFLKRGDSEGSLAFEHEIFFDHFLAKRFAGRLSEKSPATTVMLGRSAMANELSEEIAVAIVRSEIEVSKQIYILSASASATSIKQGTVRENCGKLLASIARQKGGIDAGHVVKVENMIFPGSDFSGLSLSSIEFIACELRRVSFADASIVSCLFNSSLLDAPLVTFATRFRETSLKVESNLMGLRLADSDGSVRAVYDPASVKVVLRKLGVDGIPEEQENSIRNVTDDVLSIVERVARVYSRCNPVSFEDEQNSSVSMSPFWPQLKRIYLEAGILKSEVRAAHGPRREFLRRTVRFEDLLAGLDRSAQVPGPIREFWDRLEQEFPKK
jgi:hypothetical protein